MLNHIRAFLAPYWNFMNRLDEIDFTWLKVHFQWMKQNWQEFQFAIVFFFVIGICCGIAIMLFVDYFGDIGRKVKEFEKKGLVGFDEEKEM